MNGVNGALLVLGAGCAGTELALAARAGGWNGRITLLGDERTPPYHRPPLSKAYLLGEASLDSLSLKAAAVYQNSNIELRTDSRAVAIDRTAQRVQLADGTELAYDRLALTTGGRPRRLPPAIGAAESAPNFHYLRTLSDADAIRRNLVPGQRLVIVGGGYVGLEVAAAATKLGLRVTVLEAAPRVLARVTAPMLSEFYEEVHRRAGVDIRTAQQVAGFELSGQRVSAVCCSDGTAIPADLVVAGIGLAPNSELAGKAGLVVDDGIVVDHCMQTSDAGILSAGDGTRFFSGIYQRLVRIESVPSALEQARNAALTLCGKPCRKETAPWFWSDQYDLGLKMVGLSQGYERTVVRGTPATHSFSVFYLSGTRVLAVDTVNRPLEFNLSKRLVADQMAVDPDLLEDDAVPLKSLLANTANTA